MEFFRPAAFSMINILTILPGSLPVKESEVSG